MSVDALRDLIADEELLIAPEIYDGLSAKIAADVGFDAAVMGGFAASATFGLAEPLLSFGELRDHAGMVASITDLPFIVDGATGFGNPAHTRRTVRELAQAGVAGVFIEDQVAPRRMGHHDGPLELVSPETMVDKIRAARDAVADIEADIAVVAKTQAATKDRREYESMTDAADRLNRYLDAGAELGCLYPRSTEEARTAADAVDGPVKFAASPKADFSPTFDEIAEMGYAVANTPTVATVAAAKQLRAYYQTLRDDRELIVDHTDVDEFKSYVYDLQYSGYEEYE